MRAARKLAIAIVATVTTILSLGWGWQWYTLARFEVATDNAYLHGDITSIAPRLAGYVTSVAIGDNDRVRKGDLLFRIDDRDFRAKVNESKANVAARQAEIADIEATLTLQDALVAQADAQRQSAAAEQEFAEADLDRYAKLQRSGTASEQKFQDAQAASDRAAASLRGAEANLSAQKLKIDVLTAQSMGAAAALSQANAALDLAALDLAQTLVTAPIDGVIGNRQVRVGRYVTPGVTVLDIVPVDDVWVVANFKETELGSVKAGEAVRITVDEYPGIPIQGVVDSFAPGSGAAFSLLPPDNATGNFIRIVQRVPVKIRLKANPLPGRLVPGLSVRVAVRVEDGTGAAEHQGVWQ
ncbi:HlyD family secretion protein [Mesorhizobium sp. CU2]|uniref:HlyD family secretion protein n=1 Tax=unclassified Mesorhizobium TaxID=325217 RepID=UPI00112B3EC1|nr:MULTISPECIES: HlyD family secretion protein [unclassified Mesorhizobium]TPN83242.1 HlyD family secretion protein [Mesorhizobium sp. CU3]TPO15882.1 HlyD family secretion protein [Mesorhizobium sp. CU2]